MLAWMYSWSWMYSERRGTGRTSENLSFSLMARQQCPTNQSTPHISTTNTHNERSPPAFVKTTACPLRQGKKNHGLLPSRDLLHRPRLVHLDLQFGLLPMGVSDLKCHRSGMVLRRRAGSLEVPLCRRFPMRRCGVS